MRRLVLSFVAAGTLALGLVVACGVSTPEDAENIWDARIEGSAAIDTSVVTPTYDTGGDAGNASDAGDAGDGGEAGDGSMGDGGEGGDDGGDGGDGADALIDVASDGG